MRDCVPPQAMNMYGDQIVETEASIHGEACVSSTGEAIPNCWALHVPMVTREKRVVSMACCVVGVVTPLRAAKKGLMVVGNMVALDGKWCYINANGNCDITMLMGKGRQLHVWCLDTATFGG